MNNMRAIDDLKRLQEGQGSEFNTSLADLMEIRRLQTLANEYSRFNSLDMLNLWLNTLHAIERELWAYMTEEDKKSLKESRVQSVPAPIKSMTGHMSLRVKDKLDAYDKALKDTKARKGLGVIAKEDNKNAVFR